MTTTLKNSNNNKISSLSVQDIINNSNTSPSSSLSNTSSTGSEQIGKATVRVDTKNVDGVFVHNRRHTKWPRNAINSYVESPLPACKRIVFGKNQIKGVGPCLNGNTFKFSDEQK